MNFENQDSRKSRNIYKATATQESPSKINSLKGNFVIKTQ